MKALRFVHRRRRARPLGAEAQLPRARPALRQAHAAGGRGRRGARRRAGRGDAARAAGGHHRRRRGAPARRPTTSRWRCSRSRATRSSAPGTHAVALNLELDDELRREGLAREVVHAVQNARKDAGLNVEDRIALTPGRRRRAARRGARARAVRDRRDAGHLADLRRRGRRATARDRGPRAARSRVSARLGSARGLDCSNRALLRGGSEELHCQPGRRAAYIAQAALSGRSAGSSATSCGPAAAPQPTRMVGPEHRGGRGRSSRVASAAPGRQAYEPMAVRRSGGARRRPRRRAVQASRGLEPLGDCCLDARLREQRPEVASRPRGRAWTDRSAGLSGRHAPTWPSVDRFERDGMRDSRRGGRQRSPHSPDHLLAGRAALQIASAEEPRP